VPRCGVLSLRGTRGRFSLAEDAPHTQTDLSFNATQHHDVIQDFDAHTQHLHPSHAPHIAKRFAHAYLQLTLQQWLCQDHSCHSLPQTATLWRLSFITRQRVAVDDVVTEFDHLGSCYHFQAATASVYPFVPK
jgi:hypothetical protein